MCVWWYRVQTCKWEPTFAAFPSSTGGLGITHGVPIAGGAAVGTSPATYDNNRNQTGEETTGSFTTHEEHNHQHVHEVSE